MNPLRKIPLEMLINILEDLYNGGANFVDISGDTDIDGTPRDTIKITVKPEYLSNIDDQDDIAAEEEFDINWPEENDSSHLSDEDINDLI
jgi:hypothetical protein